MMDIGVSRLFGAGGQIEGNSRQVEADCIES
jgi:hypothetical protein